MRKNVLKLVIISLLIGFVILIGPMDFFSHGYSCEATQYEQIHQGAFYGRVDLTKENYEVQFRPMRKHFVGFEIFFKDLPEAEDGKLCLAVKDKAGRQIEYQQVNLEEIKENAWYKAVLDGTLKEGQIYTLSLFVEDCQGEVYLDLVDEAYLQGETVEGNVPVNYAYEESTFVFKEKVLIIMLILAVCIALAAQMMANNTVRKIAASCSIFLFLSAIMCWNYAFNSIDSENNSYIGFQRDSEMLVTGVIYADAKGVAPNASGLGVWLDILGELDSESRYYVTNDSWEDGYSRTKPAIIICANSYTAMVAMPGNYIQFANGAIVEISDVEVQGGYRIVYLESEEVFSSVVYGKLLDATFLDGNKENLPKGKLNPYMSQYGLQGKIFGFLGSLLSISNAINNLNFLCCLAAAAVFALIVIIAAYKYDILYAGCLFATFWLSPWIVNFARNLYWVEFTWFIPMLVGLFCAWKVENRKCRMVSYFLVFFSVLVKCLCGYEYISTIMIGMVAFLLVDFLAAIIEGKKEQYRLLFGTIIIMGTTAVAGFCAAIGFHAVMRGDGDLMLGVRGVLQDALRRTGGIDINSVGSLAGRELDALTASTWETICLYFKFPTAIITGINGNLFPLLCMIPIFIFIYNYFIGKIDWKPYIMYVVFMVAALSWYVLAQNHSYVHIHMNYVLWYFGFVQTCIYIICKHILQIRNERL